MDFIKDYFNIFGLIAPNFKMIKRFYTFCIISLLTACNLSAQSYNFVRYGVREGLLHSLVTGITQDRRGDMWMSTGGGLCRFNGVEFEYFTTRDGMNFTRLTCITTDDDDNIWVGSSQGLNFICGKSITAIHDSLIRSEVLAIASAGRSMIWVVTNNGLYKVKYFDNKFIVAKITIPHFQSLATSPIFQDRVLSNFIFQTTTGKVFYSNNGQLFCINGNKVDIIKKELNISVNTGIELLNGTIIFGTNRGVFKLDGDKLVLINNKSTKGLEINDIHTDGEKIWLLGKELVAGISESNLYSIDLNNPTYFRKIGKKNGLNDEPSQMCIDHEGNIWTTSNNGVSILKPNAFEAFTTTDGMVGNKAWGIYRTNDGRLWVGTIGEGLTIIKGNKFQNYTKSNGLPDNYVGRIFQGSNGTIYVGTSNAGLCKAQYNSSTNRYTFTRLPLLLGSKVRIDDVIEDKQGVLWVATSRGLFHNKNSKVFNRIPLFKGDTGQVFIQKLLADPLRNMMWIGTRFNGVFTMQDNVVKPFDKLGNKEEVSSLALDNYGDIWIGTRTRGVFRLKNDTITGFAEKEGLSSNLIYILYPDRKNNLWVGTNLGIDRVDLALLKNTNRFEIRHYGSDEGLTDLETNLNGVFEDNESDFWIATNGGLLRYEHAADKQNTIPPKVQILSLKLNSQETDWQKFSEIVNPWNGLPNELTLKHNQNHLTFEFVGISFRNPKMVKYSWKLDGFDNNWITSSSRQAIYSNIPPGNYTFRLKAANSDMVWSNEVVSMPFKVLDPFWKTWWFRISAILFVVLMVYLYFLSRIKSFREKQKELENLVRIRTFELSEQFEIVDKKNKQIFDSLTYAKFLQNAILTSIDIIKSNFSDVFVYNKPKDFVSGDFYWYSRNGDMSVLAVADCTGHGVPGAIISVICENAIRQAVVNSNYSNPAQILQHANKYVIDTFKHTQKEIHPGMEIALCTFNHKTFELTYSGAMLSMHLVKDGDLVKLKPSVYRIGWDLSAPAFVNETVKLAKGDILYLFTDGFVDQFEPKSKKKFTAARLTNLLYQNCQLPSAELSSLLHNEFKTWQGDYEQIDDVLVVGIKV